MVDVSWIAEGMPLWLFALIIVLAYAILSKIKILGESKGINLIISIILAIIFISFTSVREYITNVTPWFTVLLVLIFFCFLLFGFLIKSDDWGKFTKPTSIVAMILFILIIIIALFHTFPEAQAVLPDSWVSSTCNHGDYDYIKKDKCYKYEDEYRCYNSGKYEWYEKCYSDGEYYKCYDYECENENEGIFEAANDFTNRKDVQNAFYLVIVAVVAGIIITRK